ncbi:MAG: methyltransferase domain-containing protein, partial [Pseudomonadota bacterium]
MSSSFTFKCRICQGIKYDEVVDLGNQVITSRFPKVGDTSTPSGLICLIMCRTCQLVQLRDTTPATEMYEHFYGYRSGINSMMKNHLASFNSEICSKVELRTGDAVLDIGSNDCTFLGNYSEGIQRFGCDPTGVQFQEFYTSTHTTLVPTYFTKHAIQETLGVNQRFKAVTSISMFYDLPDPVQFAKDVYDVLEDDGVWGLEQSYVGTMLERNSIDTICHEHLEYYGVRQIKTIMDRAGFKILDISFNECNGGSFRIYVAKASSTVHVENAELVNTFLNNEIQSGIHTIERYQQFMTECKQEVDKLVAFVTLAKKDKKDTYVYGASTKGNC